MVYLHDFNLEQSARGFFIRKIRKEARRSFLFLLYISNAAW